MPILFDFPDRYLRGEKTVPGFVDEVRWFTADRAGLAGDDVPPGAPLLVRGWMLDVDATGVPKSIVIRIDGDRNYEARVGSARPDVALALGNPDLTACGFEVVIPTTTLAPGFHELAVYSVDGPARTYAELEEKSRFYLLPSGQWFPPEIPFGESACEVHVDEIRDASYDREFDSTTGCVDVARGALLFMRGWAYDAVADQPVTSLFALVNGRKVVEAVYGIERPDVAQALKRAALGPIGFTLELPTLDLERGRHTLEIVALAPDGERLLHSGCRVELTVREKTVRARDIYENTPAFLDSVVRVADAKERERITPMRTQRGEELFVRGWAIDGSAGTAGSGVLMVIDGELEIPALYGLPRPDVAEVFGNPALARSGFTAQIPTGTLTPGRHAARCYVLASDGRGTLSTAQEFEFEVADSSDEVFTRT